MKNNQKKIMAMLMAVTLAGSGFGQIPKRIMAADDASTVVYSGFKLMDGLEEDTATYSFDETTGALTITGDGACSPLQKIEASSRSMVTSLSIDGVNKIYYCDLSDFTNLKSVYINGNNLLVNCDLFGFDIDNTVEEVRFGPGVIFDPDKLVVTLCKNLKKLDIDASTSPEGTRFGESFADFARAENCITTLPNNVTYVGDIAFSGSFKFNSESVEFPENLDTIGIHAFENSSISKLTFNGGNLISTYAFYSTTGLDEVTFKNVKRIGKEAFANSEIKNVDLSACDHIILDNRAFTNCGKLETVILPEHVDEWQNNTFSCCFNLKKAVIPATITWIPEDTFDQDNGLTIYGVKGSFAETYANENDFLFVALEEAQTTEAAQNTEDTQTTEETTTSSSSEVIRVGDLNLDGAADLTDLTLLSIMILSGENDMTKYPQADIDKNGVIDIPDLPRLKQFVSKDSSVTNLGVLTDLKTPPVCYSYKK